jgi:hypothetical protein
MRRRASRTRASPELPRLCARFGLRWHRGRSDGQLADTCDCEASPDRAPRARKLADAPTGLDRQLKRSLRRLAVSDESLAEALTSTADPVRREAIVPWSDGVLGLALAERLEQPGPFDPRRAAPRAGPPYRPGGPSLKGRAVLPRRGRSVDRGSVAGAAVARVTRDREARSGPRHPDVRSLWRQRHHRRPHGEAPAWLCSITGSSNRS